MNGVDLFSGIGGITLALAPWVRPVAYCEIDEYACGVLLSRMANGELPHAPIWDDVATLQAHHLGGLNIDIITGGFPCQDISVAGSGRGLDGERSGLYREVFRLVGELRPRYVFLENVPGIRTKGLSTVIGDLAGLRYDARWTTLSAAQVGAPHKRDRWWLLARRRDWWQPSLTANANGIAIRKQPERREPRKTKQRDSVAANAPKAVGRSMADTNGGGLASNGTPHHHGGGESLRNDNDGRFALPSWERESAPFPAIRNVDDGLSGRVDRLRCLGNSVVPACAREAFRLLAGL